MTIRERVEAARAGSNPYVICRVESGWVIAFDDQPVNGYCLIMCDPVVSSLNDLPEAARLVYLRDMARVGDALLAVTGAARINYETWCNKDQSLHTHIVPRFANEPEDKKYLPVCKAYATAPKFEPSSAEGASFLARMRSELE